MLTELNAKRGELVEQRSPCSLDLLVTAITMIGTSHHYHLVVQIPSSCPDGVMDLLVLHASNLHCSIETYYSEPLGLPPV